MLSLPVATLLTVCSAALYSPASKLAFMGSTHVRPKSVKSVELDRVSCSLGWTTNEAPSLRLAEGEAARRSGNSLGDVHARKWIYLTISRHSENRAQHDTCNSAFLEIKYCAIFWTVFTS